MLDNYRDLIDELLGTPTLLRELTAGHGETVPPEAAALVAELRDRDEVVLGRLRTITQQQNAQLKALPEPTPIEGGGDVGSLLAGFDTARGELVSLLMNLTLKDWERTATHEIDGEITLADEVERHVEFDETHVARLRAALGG